MTGAAVLDDHALAIGDVVEVELLVVGQPTQVAPRLVVGTIVGATPAVLILRTRPPLPRIRVPWSAVALIRDAHPADHPAL